MKIDPESKIPASQFRPAPWALSGKVQYGLRFQILPDAFTLRRAKEVARFCVRHRIPGVHLFFNGEEWNRGHATGKEIRQWLDMFRKIIPVFRKAGLSVSLNPWSTTLHCDRGRTLRAGQDFELMVSPSGKKSKAVASFACPRWRSYIAEIYGRMAALGFDVLWIEDDFRYHNHAPLEWGGDFSPAMLKLFSARIGRNVGRQEVVRNVLKSGKPHRWRRLWLDTWRECQEKTASEMRDAVAAANSTARLGLMSSHPDTHAAEGRQWEGLFRAMAIGGQAGHRPHCAHYDDAVNAGLFYSYSQLDLQKRLCPAWVESHPEIENFPFSRFNKSDTQTFIQMALAKIMGAEGLLLDLHPFAANGIFEEPEVGELLDKSYPALEWLSRCFSRDMTGRGVGVPFIPAAPLERRLNPKATFHDLIARSELAGILLGHCGIAWQMDFSPSANAIWGSNAWGLTDEQIQKCLGGGLWLDAEAAEIFVRRGYSEQLGIRIEGWREREKSLYSIERIVSRKTGVRPGFNLNCNLIPGVLQFQTAAQAETWTALLDCYGRRMGAALSVYRNSAGGTVAVSAFPLAEERVQWNLNFQRQTLVQSLIKALSGQNAPAMVLKAPHCLVMDLAGANDRRVAVINLASDPIAPEVVVPEGRRIQEADYIMPLEKPRKGRVATRTRNAGLTVKAGRELPFCGMMILSVR